MESKTGGVCLFWFPVFIKQNHHSQQVWIPELPLMTRSKQMHAQPPQPLPNTHSCPSQEGYQSRMDVERPPREAPTFYTSPPNPAAKKKKKIIF